MNNFVFWFFTVPWTIIASLFALLILVICVKGAYEIIMGGNFVEIGCGLFAIYCTISLIYILGDNSP